jgi:hypothetical protein
MWGTAKSSLNKHREGYTNWYSPLKLFAQLLLIQQREPQRSKIQQRKSQRSSCQRSSCQRSKQPLLHIRCRYRSKNPVLSSDRKMRKIQQPQLRTKMLISSFFCFLKRVKQSIVY